MRGTWRLHFRKSRTDLGCSPVPKVSRIKSELTSLGIGAQVAHLAAAWSSYSVHSNSTCSDEARLRPRHGRTKTDLLGIEVRGSEYGRCANTRFAAIVFRPSKWLCDAADATSFGIITFLAYHTCCKIETISDLHDFLDYIQALVLQTEFPGCRVPAIHVKSTKCAVYLIVWTLSKIHCGSCKIAITWYSFGYI